MLRRRTCEAPRGKPSKHEDRKDPRKRTRKREKKRQKRKKRKRGKKSAQFFGNALALSGTSYGVDRV